MTIFFMCIPNKFHDILLCFFKKKVFVDDSLGDRAWIENDRCRMFVDNLLTAFSTKLPPRITVPPATEAIKSEHSAEGTVHIHTLFSSTLPYRGAYISVADYIKY